MGTEMLDRYSRRPGYRGRIVLPLMLAGLLAACAEPEEIPAEIQEQAPPPPVLGLGVDLDNMDRSVRPQDDFFQYMNGGWMARTEIPADRSRWGSFDELVEMAEQQVLDIITEAAETPGHVPGSDEQKVADMFLSFMGEAVIEASGLDPLQAEFDAINALQDHDELPEFWASMVMQRYAAPVSFGVSQDPGQSDRYITILGQAGLGLPDRDYYLSDDERFVSLRNQYRDHVVRLLTLADIVDDAEAAADNILSLETGIANGHWTRVQNRDRNATYNLMSVAELEDMAPGFGWARFLDTAGLGDVEEINVRQPDYLTAVGDQFREGSMEAWRDYHRYHVLRANAPYLPSAFVEEHFDFFSRTLRGQPEMREREKRGVATVESVLGFMVGRMYVERNFTAEAAERMNDMVENIKLAFAEAIDELEWMSDATKQEAQDKLASLNTKIGHPDEDAWRDYSCVAIAADDLIGNLRRSTECEWERLRNRLDEEVDRGEWFMTPQTVNAYYSSSMNEIVFPAAILQPPFFNVEADDAVNYGAIGGVIGHEITHAFDDQGRRSDGEGNLRDWWTEEDEAQFRERAQVMIDQYSSYEPVEGAHIQGALSLGENIADLGGLRVAYRAWQMSLDGEPAPVIEGFTGSQRVFMGWGQVWRNLQREEALRQQLVTGPHSPARYRVIGVLSNMPEFYEAFGVTEGDDMYRSGDERVMIW